MRSSGDQASDRTPGVETLLGRIEEPQAGEPGESAVASGKMRAVAEAEGRDVGIGHEVAPHAAVVASDLSETVPGFGALVQPRRARPCGDRVDELECREGRCRFGEDARMGDDAHEPGGDGRQENS